MAPLSLRRPRRRFRLSQYDVRVRLIAVIALLIAAGAAVGLSVSLVGAGSSGPIDQQSAAIGDEVFNRAAAQCRLTAATARTLTASRPSLLLGVSASLRLFRGQARCEEARLAQATGVQAVRDDLSWAQAEPQPNRYNWSGYDAVVRTATEAGLVVLPVLDDAPSWAAPTGISLPLNPASYAEFVAAAVSRYGPGGSFWRANPRLPQHPLVWYELWNEPYYADVNRNPGVYARLVRAATAAGRAANPAARFLAEAVDYYQTLAGGRADWIAGMHAAMPDLGRYFDAVAVHPYGGDPAISAPPGSAGGAPAHRIAQVRRELVADGYGNKPVWVTEIGWSTCSGADVCVSEAQQATYLQTFLKLADTTWRSYVRAVFVYDLRDVAPNPVDDREAWFGLVRPDLTHKPAWQVLHEAAQGVL
jgi:hypothetical protein